VAVLCSRGASRTEAEDLVADLWADCFATNADARPLLSKYQGRSSLESWLITVGMHRLVDLKRRQSFRVYVRDSANSAEDFLERTPQPAATLCEEPLLVLLQNAIGQAFISANPDDVLMLKLVHLYALTQREVGRMWGWHESKVSRTLEGARTKIAQRILLELKKTDPWLELRWEDFVELCERSPDILPWMAQDKSQTSPPRQSKMQSEAAVV
jgi:RNA polymerase sigma factor (sigma-70 family)